MALALTPPEPIETLKMELPVPSKQVQSNEAISTIPLNDHEKNGLEQAANQYVINLFTISEPHANDNIIHPDLFKKQIQEITELGNKEILEATQLSNGLMDLSLNSMMKSDSQVNQEIANGIVELRQVADQLNPVTSGIDFSQGAAGTIKGKKLFGIIPLPTKAANEIQKYFLKYETGQESINRILTSLENGKNKLTENNNALLMEKNKSWNIMLALRNNIYYAQTVVSKIHEKVEQAKRENKINQAIEKIVTEDILFPLEQKIMDMETQLAISVNGYISYDLIIKVNNELINGVNRSQTSTLSALKNAVTIANALYQQKIVLDAIQGLKTTTESLILASSQMLKTQGAQTFKDAASSTIDPKVLQENFNNLLATTEMVNNYRSEAVQKLQQERKMLSELNSKAIGLSDKVRQQQSAKLLN